MKSIILMKILLNILKFISKYYLLINSISCNKFDDIKMEIDDKDQEGCMDIDDNIILDVHHEQHEQYEQNEHDLEQEPEKGSNYSKEEKNDLRRNYFLDDNYELFDKYEKNEKSDKDSDIVKSENIIDNAYNYLHIKRNSKEGKNNYNSKDNKVGEEKNINENEANEEDEVDDYDEEYHYRAFSDDSDNINKP